MSSVFLPLAFNEWVLHSLTSWSRLSECSAGELYKIWVVAAMLSGEKESEA